jgi:hypothetical protein
MGKVVQPLQSINCHDRCAHGHERHGPFTRLVGFGWVGFIEFESSWSGSWYAVGAKPVHIWDAYERWSAEALDYCG